MPANPNDIWREAKAPNGRIYYYKKSTRETTWTKPGTYIPLGGTAPVSSAPAATPAPAAITPVSTNPAPATTNGTFLTVESPLRKPSRGKTRNVCLFVPGFQIVLVGIYQANATFPLLISWPRCFDGTFTTYERQETKYLFAFAIYSSLLPILAYSTVDSS